MPPRGGGGGGGGGQPIGNIFGNQKKPGETLAEVGIDLTQLAAEGKLDPVIGRDAEIKRMIQILSRRTKSNPVLIAPAGVGKTAIVEGLAQRIHRKEVPESLHGKKVISVDLAGLVAGSAFRGSFEEKFKSLLSDIDASAGNTIIFVDELHNLMNLGKAEGSVTGSEIIKPALARGLQLAGASTLDEYRKTIEKDAALARRFQPIIVQEPTVEQTITILRGLKAKYSSHHGVEIADSALVSAARYSDRYISDRYLPDKAIDLIDEAASSLRLSLESKPDELEALERRLITLQIELESLRNDNDSIAKERKATIDQQIQATQEQAREMEQIWRNERARMQEIKDIRIQLEQAKQRYSEAKLAGKWTEAAELEYAVIPQLEGKIPKDTDLDPRTGQAPGQVFLHDRVSSEDVARVVSKMTGVPLKSLLLGERERLLRLEEELSRSIVGQDAAVHSVAEAVRLSRAGLAPLNRPTASFLMLGPTGVGKTLMAKQLAKFLFDSERALITINMSEYTERHTVARLIGAPAGYIGYEDSGQLEQVRRKPFSVLLLDEFEKAHKDVSNILLQILDEGMITDSQGRKIDFRNTIIILTSNLGSTLLMQEGASDPTTGRITPEAKRAVLDLVQLQYPPELINRLDEQIVFNRLGPDSFNKIVDIRIAELQAVLDDKRITLILEQEARDWLAKEGYSPVYGARSLNRLVTKAVRSPISAAILRGTIRPGDDAVFIRTETGIELVEQHPAETAKEAEIIEDDEDDGDLSTMSPPPSR